MRATACAEREIKVGEQDMAGALQQDILGLQVAVNEAQEVQVLQRQQNLGSVEASMRLRKALVWLLMQQLEQLAASAKLRRAPNR
jgi:hypothetical protein